MIYYTTVAEWKQELFLLFKKERKSIDSFKKNVYNQMCKRLHI